MEIRKAEARDFEAYCLILSEIDALHAEHEPHYFRATTQPSRKREFFDEWLQSPEKELFVAYQGSELAGLMHLEKRSTPDFGFLIGNDFAHMGTLLVAERFQKQGVGKALITIAEAWAKAAGLKELRLNVWSFNQQAITFYESQGFRPGMQTMIKRLT